MIGFAPEQVDRMSLWEFTACMEGYRKANMSGDEPLAPPTADEFRQMVEARARVVH